MSASEPLILRSAEAGEIQEMGDEGLSVWMPVPARERLEAVSHVRQVDAAASNSLPDDQCDVLQVVTVPEQIGTVRSMVVVGRPSTSVTSAAARSPRRTRISRRVSGTASGRLSLTPASMDRSDHRLRSRETSHFNAGEGASSVTVRDAATC